MERKINLDLPGQHYYINIPSHANQNLFSSVFAYDALLNIFNKQESIELQGYCLLPASLHLLVFSNTEPSQWLDPVLMQYNQWHQTNSGNSGYLFSDEKRTQLLVQPRLLPRVLKYIQNIPVHKKICSRSDQFLYSSYHDYMGVQDTGVETSRILAAISHHSGQRIRRFEDFMLNNQTKEPLDFVTGNHDFYYAIADRTYLTKALSSYANVSDNNSEEDNIILWQQCLEALGEATQLDSPTLLGIRRHHSLPDAHFLLVWLYVEVAKGPLYIAAKQLGLDEITLKLNINSIQLHHPEAYLRYIANSWQSSAVA